MSYQLFKENPLTPDSIGNQAFKGVQMKTILNQTYMSQANIDLIQQQIRYNVFMKSRGKFKIGPQNPTELQIIMKSIYLQYAKNLPNRIPEQIKELNGYVIDEAVSKIMSEILMYQAYLKRASSQPIPLSHPENVSSAGRKLLPSVTNTFMN